MRSPHQAYEDACRRIETLEAQNAEMRRLLEKHQWRNRGPFDFPQCIECSGERGHRASCKIAAVLKGEK